MSSAADSPRVCSGDRGPSASRKPMARSGSKRNSHPSPLLSRQAPCLEPPGDLIRPPLPIAPGLGLKLHRSRCGGIQVIQVHLARRPSASGRWRCHPTADRPNLQHHGPRGAGRQGPLNGPPARIDSALPAGDAGNLPRCWVEIAGPEAATPLAIATRSSSPFRRQKNHQRAWRDSNPRHSEPESDALSN